jgi:hypothetical protein
MINRSHFVTLIKGVIVMKSRLKKKYLAQLVTIVLGSMFAITAHTAPTVITNGVDTSATIADAGYFSAASALGLSFMDREFVNHGTFSSNWSLNANGFSAGIADESSGSNPFSSTAITDIDGSVLVTSSLGSDWSIIERITIPSSGHIAVEIQLTNNTGATAMDVEWGVGIDPDQGVPAGFSFETRNVINALGDGASVTATSPDGWALTLADLIGGPAHTAAYVDPSNCCSPVDPHLMLTAGQLPDNYGFFDRSINLAYDLGTIANNQSVSFGYEYVMAISDPFTPPPPPPPPVPEPMTYAMLLAGLGLLGFAVRRRKGML